MRRYVLLGVAALVAVGAAAAWAQLPALAAGGLLHPARTRVSARPPEHCVAASFDGADVTLSGWRCSTPLASRGTIVYLHGVADNRGSSSGVVPRFLGRGFNVIAYDSRAHGDSGGDACTYGYFEKQDLRRVVDAIGGGPVVLIGTSLGAAVALQEAADDPRVVAVVAAETFSDLRTVARERAPFILSESVIAQAFSLAERDGDFRVDDVSPMAAASRISIPVLLLHGAADDETPPAHSERVYAAVRGPRRLILVPGAHHNQSLNTDVWPDIDRWIDAALAARAAHSEPIR